jgi:hypothetical protein
LRLVEWSERRPIVLLMILLPSSLEKYWTKSPFRGRDCYESILRTWNSAFVCWSSSSLSSCKHSNTV